MKERAGHALPLLLAVALHAWASGGWVQDSFVATFALAGIVLGGRVPLGPTGRRTLTVVFLLIGAALGWVHVPDLGYGPGTLPRSASLVAVGSLAAAAARLYVRGSWAGERASFVLGMLAVAASGATRLGPAYGAFAAAFLACAFVSLRLRDVYRARPSALRPLHYASLAVGFVVASAITYGLTRAAPQAYDAVQRAFDRAYAPRDLVGFGSGASLGSMRDLLKSDDEVLRIHPPPHAPPVDYLRGATYDLYRTDGLWTSSDATDRMRDIHAALGADEPLRFRVHRVGGNATRYFLPLRAARVTVPEGEVDVDGTGIVRTARSVRVSDYAFVLGDRSVDLAPIPPTRFDLEIPPSERAAIEQLARTWVPEELAPPDTLERIRVRLARDYAYSLSFTREADDPLLDFLFRQKLGYCTYFASAMAILARAHGIPARLVAGYRVSEWSPIGGEYVVREKNAHAWVEAWVDGAWRTYDPTPLSELPQDSPHIASFSTLAGDAFNRVTQAVEDGVAHVTPEQLVVILVALGALWFGVRVLRARVRRSRHGAAAERVERPLPCFVRLTAAIERRRGVTREPSESLERFAHRLAGAGLADAAALVERYAALRYGGRGDQATLDRDVDQFVAGPS
jgi:transglutaminase-like putative cysteine protease